MRYAVLSDIHANLPALHAVLDDLATQQVAGTLYLGDAVGYYADNAAVIELLREIVMTHPCVKDGQAAAAPLWVAGNHEWGMLGRLEEHLFRTAALSTLRQARSDLSSELLAFLEELPQSIEVNLGDAVSVTLVHASPVDPIGINEYLKNSEDAAAAAAHFTTSLCLVGHTHYPRICHESGMVLHGRPEWSVIDVFDAFLPDGCYRFGPERFIGNPGSVGQPRDGDPRASYAILDTAARTFTVRRVPYDIAATRARFHDWRASGSAALSDDDVSLLERLDHGI